MEIHYKRSRTASVKNENSLMNIGICLHFYVKLTTKMPTTDSMFDSEVDGLILNLNTYYYFFLLTTILNEIGWNQNQ